MKYPAFQTRSSWAPCRLLCGWLVGGQELFQGDPSILFCCAKDEDAKRKRIVMVAEDLIPTLQELNHP